MTGPRGERERVCERLRRRLCLERDEPVRPGKMIGVRLLDRDRPLSVPITIGTVVGTCWVGRRSNLGERRSRGL